MASLNPYETLKQPPQGLAASHFIAGRHRYDALVERHAPKQSSAHKPGRRHSRVYSATLSPHNNQAHVPQKSLAEQLKQAPNAAAQAKILVDAVKQNPRLINDGKLWQSLKWEGQPIGNVAGLNTLPLNKINLNGVDLSKADLTNANLEGAQINGANFSGAKMDGANLTNAQANFASFAGANLHGATLSGGTFTNVNFSHATLLEVKARGVNFNGAQGDNVQMSGNFREAALGVNFHGSGIGSGDYTDADVSNAKFTDTAGVENLKGAKGVPKVTSSNFAFNISTGPTQPDRDFKLLKNQPPNVAALAEESKAVPVAPHRPSNQSSPRQWAMHPAMAPAPAA